jgi:colicin import membrane protein
MIKRAAYPVRPPHERGTWRALALAVVMHLLLAAFLFFGIHWKNSSPTGSEAELWTDTSVLAPTPPAPVAPAPVQPAPPPPPQEDADIALQQAKRKQIEQQQKEAALLADQQKQAQLKLQQQEVARQKQLADQQAALTKQKAARDAADKAAQAEASKQAQLEADKRKQQLDQKQQQLAEQQKADQQKADAAKADQQKAAKAKQEADAKAKAAADQARRARLASLQGAAGGGETTGTGAGTTGSATGGGGNGSPGYADKVRQRVKPNITFSGAVDGNPAAVVSVSCAPDGTILSARVSSSSGNQAWDDAVLRAVQASDPMPRDVDGKAPRSFQIRFRPKD